MGTKRKNHKWTEKEEKEIVEWYNGRQYEMYGI